MLLKSNLSVATTVRGRDVKPSYHSVPLPVLAVRQAGSVVLDSSRDPLQPMRESRYLIYGVVDVIY